MNIKAHGGANLWLGCAGKQSVTLESRPVTSPQLPLLLQLILLLLLYLLLLLPLWRINHHVNKIFEVNIWNLSIRQHKIIIPLGACGLKWLHFTPCTFSRPVRRPQWRTVEWCYKLLELKKTYWYRSICWTFGKCALINDRSRSVLKQRDQSVSSVSSSTECRFLALDVHIYIVIQ